MLNQKEKKIFVCKEDKYEDINQFILKSVILKYHFK